MAMWEYAILHPPTSSNGQKYCIVHAEVKGISTTYVNLECNKEIKLIDGEEFFDKITHIKGNKCRLNFNERKWSSLNPVFADQSIEWEKRGDYPHSLLREKTKMKKTLSAEIIDWKFIFRGDIVQSLYVGDNVMEVLTAAGLDSWELVGFVPDSTKLRMLRRKTLP